MPVEPNTTANPFIGSTLRWVARRLWLFSSANAGPSSPAKSSVAVGERRLIALLIGILVVLPGLIAIPLWTGRMPIVDDLGAFFLPIRAFYAHCLASGESFDWMPQLFGGFFMTAEGQQGAYHPLHLLMYRVLPTDVALKLEIALPYVLMPLGLIVFLRRFIGLAGACMGALLYTYSQQFMFAMRNPPSTMILAHMPWILLAMVELAKSRERSQRCFSSAAIASLTASQILLGYPQLTWFSLVVEGVFALFLLIHYRPSRAAWAALAGAYALALCLASVQLLTTYDFLKDSSRGAPSLDLKTSYSLAPIWMLGVIAPYLHWEQVPFWAGIYFGAVPLLLGLWWLTAHRAGLASASAAEPTAPLGSPTEPWKATGWLALIFLGMAGLTTELAFGNFGDLYYLQTCLPIVGNFRAPARYMIVATLGVTIVAAIAFARLVAFVRSGKKVAWGHLVLPWLAVIASVGAAYYFMEQNLQSHIPFKKRLFITAPVVFLAAAVALTLAARGRRSGLYLLVAIAAFDLIAYNLLSPCTRPCWLGNMPTYEDYLVARPGPPGACPGRLYDTVYGENQFAAEGYRLINGYAGLEPVKQLDYEHVASLRVAGVCWSRQWIATPPIPGWPKAESKWQEVSDPLPRARLVSRTAVSGNAREDLKAINLDETALVTHNLDLTPSAARARIASDRPGALDVEVDAPADQLLVFSESYSSGWKAYVDEKPVTVERVNGDFLGCVVPAGTHQVRFRFDPLSLRAGKCLSLAGLGACLTLLVAGFVYRRSERQASGVA